MSRPITAAALSQIESGKVKPTRQTLDQLADVLKVPVGFFAAQWAEPGPDAGRSRTYFRDLRGTSARVRRQAGAYALLLSDVVSALELHVQLPTVQVPTASVGEESTRDDIEAAAGVVRAEWGLGDEPVPHVVRELERRGVAIARLHMGHRFTDAFSVRTGRRPLVLLASDRDDYVRSRFDASHELGHLVMHRDSEPGSRVVERQAHDFASSFLFPASEVAELPSRIDSAAWGALAELKRHWGISMAALLYRANTSGRLDPRSYQNAMKYMSSRGWRTDEPGRREMGAPESPLMLGRAVKTFEVTSDRSLADLCMEHGLPVAEIQDLLEASVDARPIVEL